MLLNRYCVPETILEHSIQLVPFLIKLISSLVCKFHKVKDLFYFFSFALESQSSRTVACVREELI